MRQLLARLGVPLLAIIVSACGSAAPVSAAHTPSGEAYASASSATVPDQDAIPGPDGLTLRAEIGAVMTVGFTGPPAGAVLEDWRDQQFGGLLVVPNNHNGGDAAGVRALIAAVRGVMRHPLLAAANQEGGSVCLVIAGYRASAAPGRRGRSGRGQWNRSWSGCPSDCTS